MKEFLTAKVICSADSESLKKLAKKKGIVIPSDHLGAFKTVYARIEDANRNKVRLSREAVEAALPSLIGSQVNINHWRENWTVGSIFWAKVNDNDEIEIAFTFFKDVYPKEHEIALALFDKGELTVSFELKADPDTIEFHNDGTRTLNDVTFVGVGLLLDEKPAEPTAIVFEMAKRIVTELIENDTPDLIYAKEAVVNCKDLLETINKALEEKKELNSNLDLPKDEANEHRDEVSEPNIEKDLEEGGKEIMVEKKKEDLEKKEVVETIKAPVEEKADDKKVEDTTEKVEDKAKESQEEVVEEKADESTEEKTEDKVEEKADLEVVTKVDKTITETMDENSDTVEVESEVKTTVKRDGDVVSETLSETTEKTTWTFAEVEKIKADYEATITSLKADLESKDAEVEVAAEKAVKIEKLRAELGDYVEDFSDEDFENEDKLENARLKKENDSLKANKDSKEDKEVVDEKASEDEVVETASLETGHKESPEVSSPKSALRKLLKSKK